VLVIRENVRGQKIFAQDNQGRPKLQPANPPIKLPRGAHVSVSSDFKASRHDSGNGVVHALDGLYLKITAYPPDGRAAGSFVRMSDVADFGGGAWMVVNPQIIKTNPQILKGRDLKGKPFFEPTPQENRVQIPAGVRFRVSTTHSESDKDSGDGVIVSSGLQEYYLVLECPQVPEGEGLYVEKEEVVPAA
jgi:hypothetical protein